MAQAKKRKTATGQKRGRRKQAVTSPLRLEIQNWVVFLILLLITLGVYLKSSMGIVGGALNSFFVGLFGFSAYLITVYSLIIAGMNLFGKLTAKLWLKLGAGYGAILLAATLLHIINGQELKAVADMYRGATWLTGGVVGGGIGALFVSVLGKTGSIVVILFLFIIGGIIITERSIVKGMQQAADKTREKGRRVKTYTREQAQKKQQRREEKRIQERLREESGKIWSGYDEDGPQLGIEKATYPGENRQIVIHGLQEEPLKKDGSENPIRKTSPVGRKRPIEDGTVDIPLISHDSYLERKQRIGRRKQEELEEPAEELLEPEILIEEKEGQEDLPLIVEEPEKTEDESALSIAPELSDQAEAPEYQEEMEAFAENISMEKAFSKEEFPTGYQDQDETMQKMGMEEDLHETRASDFKNPPKAPGPSGHYEFPSIELLKEGNAEGAAGSSKEELLKSAKLLEDALLSFGVEAKVIQVNKGPAVTRFELQPKQGVKVSRIVNLTDDIAMNLAASSIRIEAPIPGKSAVGIEVPNKEISMVTLREIIDSDTFRKAPSKLTFSLGKDIDGEVRVADIAKMPHLLIAGATGSGKSVCINSLIVSLIYKADPNEVKLILIDPKVVELSVYNGIPHLLLPVVNDPKKASATLNWAVQEMTKRYKKFADMNVRDIRGYNEAVIELGEEEKKLPQIVIVIDELADLMMVASKEVEASICRIAQMARAAGMHLVIATQRPSVDVITGLIKANIPSRLAFAVSSGVDSRTILDNVGAERLLGKGDMLFSPIGASKPVRIQGTFVSDKEVEEVVQAVRLQSLQYDADLMDTLQREEGTGSSGIEDEIDEYLEEAVKFVVDKQRASISMLQRAFRIGFNRAARLMDALYARGVVGPDEGSKPRKVLMTKEEWENDQY